MRFYFLFVFFVLGNALPINQYPTLQNLDWEAGGSYKATGVSVKRVVTYGDYNLPYTVNQTKLIEQSDQDALLVIDTVNKRMLLDMQSGGQYYYFHNRSYIQLSGRPCGYVN